MNGNTYRVLVAKPEGRKQLGRTKCRWKGIKLFHKEMEMEELDWTCVAEGRDGRRAFLETLLKFWFPPK